MNYLTYPFKTLSITQSYKGTYSHKGNYEGYPKDFPIDENGGSTLKDCYFYCPCNSMTIKRIYGTNSSRTNTIWLQSDEKVVTPTFNDYVTILLMHPEDKDLESLYVGKKFSRGDRVTIEGKDGNATGNHFHMSVGKGKYVGNGWKKNSYGSWVINTTDGGVKPENAFYIDINFTKIINSKGIKFQYLPKLDNCYYVTASSLNVRKGPGLNFDRLNTLIYGTKITSINEVNGWIKIGNEQWISKNYLSTNKTKEVYNTKVVNTGSLNVRSTPNGNKCHVNAPIVYGTIVSVVDNNDYWTMINKNRWVYTYYLK